MSKKVACVIPARLESKRFPRKILAKLGDKYLLQRVWEAAKECPYFSDVYFAIDSQITAELITSFGGAYAMTSVSCPNGTHRLIEFMNQKIIQADVWVSWQADEPFIQSNMIRDLLQGINSGGAVWTLKKRASSEEVHSSDIVKVVTDKANRALYFSRSPIPFDRDQNNPVFYKHIGLYAYSTEALQQIASFEETPLCYIEKLEQLQFLEQGIPVHVYETTYATIGIDTPQDLIKASLLVNV